jgi:hypothetical protein
MKSYGHTQPSQTNEDLDLHTMPGVQRKSVNPKYIDKESAKDSADHTHTSRRCCSEIHTTWTAFRGATSPYVNIVRFPEELDRSKIV